MEIWTRTCPSDGKPRYIRMEGERVILTREKKGKLAIDIPDGWDVKVVNNHLKLHRTK